MSQNPFLARFADHAPALVAQGQHGLFQNCLTQAAAQMADFERRDTMSERPVMHDDFWFPANDWRATFRPYVVKAGILYIPVKGVLLNDFGYSLGSWATGYTYIWKAFERGMADPEVKGIALVCHTPGGEVAGNFDLVDKMYAMKGTKPIYGFAHEAAYSAGYSLISVADTIWVSRTGGVGSIGVVTSHVNMATAMEKYGYEITFIFAGKHKVDGNPYEALPDDVKARIQTRIDALYDVFVSTVARNRPRLSEQEVRDTEALTFTAPEAVSNGLADKIGSLDDAVAAFAADLSSDEGEEQMSAQKDNTAVDQAVHEAAVATARTEGEAAGRSAERSRIVAIIGGDVGKERPTAALAAALETDMTADQANAFLGKLPVEKSEAPAAAVAGTEEPVAGTPGGGVGNRFDDAMQNSPNPNQSGQEAGQVPRHKRALALSGLERPDADKSGK